MITPAAIHEIERLLKEGQHSRRQIAELAGVARGSVTAVVSGERRVDDFLDQTPIYKPLSKPRRCPSCGGMVRMPCKLCQTRELMRSKSLTEHRPILDTPIGLNLKPEEQARYAEVRRWRREARRMGVITTPQTEPA